MILALSSKIFFTKRLTIKVPLPPEIAPKSMAKDPHLRLSLIRGASSVSPYSMTSDTSQLGRLGIGLGEFELRLSKKRKIRFWIWNGAQDYYMFGGSNIYFIHKKDVLALTFYIKRHQKNCKQEATMPILPNEMLAEIYKNTVGFLLKGRDMQNQYKKYRIPYKRGVLLSGPPGCGKTMSCRWLRELCSQNNLAYRVISMEDYKDAIQRGRVRALFKLPGKKSGVIFFDDMDVMVKDRKKSGESHELSTFLSELDGLDPAEGVVYVFTTNYVKELDPAFVRPGRIDLWLPFHLPSTKLRKKFVNQLFNEEIKNDINAESIVERTKDYSFAELEEIRKLFCMDLIDDKPISIDRTFKIFDKHRKEFEDRAIMGFGSLDEDDNDDDYEDDDNYNYNLPALFL
jgi:hypothetical protein